ncbi:ComEC family competence protein [Patescibacteria group bacterium]|nr:ComEC family competence protein [Patescibacteria group bacterium]
MTPSKVFLYFCLSFVGGIFLSSIITLSQILILGFLISGIFCISVFWRYKKIAVFGFCLLFLVGGIFRHQLAESNVLNSELRYHNDKEEIITLVGIVAKEPDVREKSIKLTVNTENISQTNQYENGFRAITGRVLVTTWRYPGYQYGDKLKITGKLETPPKFEDFNYKDYLKKEGIYSVIGFPEIELIGKNQGNLVYAGILSFKNKLRGQIYSYLNPPQSSILGAMLLGDKRKISEEWKQKLNVAGVRHITAISGLHVTILTVILMTLLIGLGFWRQQAFYFTIIFITIFIIMTGFQPSAVRAGIMGGLFLLAQHLGRQNVSYRAIVFAGAVMLLQNPFLLTLDVGFQLSFLAMMGIIYFLPVFRNLLKFIPVDNIKTILAMTFSAYLFTLPILIYNFGYISVVSPITNVLIIPSLYWIMIFGFLFVILGTISPVLGWILSFPVWILLTYIVKIVDLLSDLPLASLAFTNIHWIWILISYLVLGSFAFYLDKKSRFPSAF